MRTVLVNPTRRRKRRTSRKKTTKRRKKRNVALTRRSRTMKNPRRRRRRVTRRRRRRNYSAAVSNPRRRRRRRRRNAGIRPFVKKSNPLILQNPRRRRRRNPKMNIQKVANQLLIYTGGSAIAVGANILAINKIGNMWARNGVRVACAVFAPMFIKGDLGAAFSGAMLYPVIEEMASELNIAPEDADLEMLAADLEQALNEVDYDEYGYQTNPVLW